MNTNTIQDRHKTTRKRAKGEARTEKNHKTTKCNKYININYHFKCK